MVINNRSGNTGNRLLHLCIGAAESRGNQTLDGSRLQRWVGPRGQPPRRDHCASFYKLRAEEQMERVSSAQNMDSFRHLSKRRDNAADRHSSLRWRFFSVLANNLTRRKMEDEPEVTRCGDVYNRTPMPKTHNGSRRTIGRFHPAKKRRRSKPVCDFVKRLDT
jgi:hypothetical protein